MVGFASNSNEKIDQNVAEGDSVSSGIYDYDDPEYLVHLKLLREEGIKLRKMGYSPEEFYRYERQLMGMHRHNKHPEKVKNVRLDVLKDPFVEGTDMTSTLIEKIQKLLNIHTPVEQLKQVVREHDPSDLQTNSYYDYFRVAQKFVKSNKTRFVDEDFRYGMECVATEEAVRTKMRDLWLYIKWVGLSRFRPNPDWVSRVDTIDPKDIHQGELGNCYFLATLSSMARKPIRIQKLFIKGCREKIEYDEQGPWGIWICIGGIWRQVIVDEYLPFNGQNELKPYFSRPPEKKIWPMLVEKCWAKVSYSYADSVEGTCMEAMHCLTGAPCFSYKLRNMDLEQIVGTIQEAYQKGYITTASSLKNDEVVFYGITPGHAYSLFDPMFVHKNPATQELEFSTTREGAQDSIIRLRNPWASTNKWSGKYSRTDSTLSAAAKGVLYKTPDVETGDLWISVADFKRFFGDLEICHYIDNYVYTSFPMRRIDPSFVKIGLGEQVRDLPIIYEVTITTPGRYYFGANQMAMRAFPPNIRSYYRIVRASLLLYRHDEVQLTYLKGMASSLLHTFIFEDLNPGKYYIAMAAQFKTNFNFITLSSYGPAEISIQVAHNFKSTETIRVLEYLFLHQARTKDPKDLQSTSTYPELKSLHQIREDGYGYFYFKNTSQKLTYQVDCKLQEFVNLQFLSAAQSNAGSESLCVSLGPGQETIALYIQRDTPNRIKFQVFVTPVPTGYSSCLPTMPRGFGKGMHLPPAYLQGYNGYGNHQPRAIPAQNYDPQMAQHRSSGQPTRPTENPSRPPENGMVLPPQQPAFQPKLALNQMSPQELQANGIIFQPMQNAPGKHAGWP